MTTNTTSSTGGRQRSHLLAAAAFLVGVLGTAAAMTLFGHPAAAPTEAVRPVQEGEGHGEGGDSDGARGGHEEHEEGGHAEGESSATVRLSPEGQKTAGIRTEPAAYRTLREGLAVPGTVEALQGRVAKVTPPVAGKVVQVMARLGDSVRAGQTLAVLDSYEVAQAHAAEDEARARVRQAEAAVQTARAEVGQARGRQSSAEAAVATQRELARAGAFSQAPLQAAQSDLAEAQSALIAAQTELQTHEAAYARAERLFQEGIVAGAELEEARLELSQDRTEVERARARVDIAKQALARERKVAEGGLLNRQAVQAAEAEVRAAAGEVTLARRLVEAAETNLEGARTALAAARANLAALEGAGGHAEGDGGRVLLFAPIAGVVADVDATLGESVERGGAALFQIADLAAVVVRANVPEKDVARVRVGQRVEVTVAAFPKERFRGVVQSVASSVDGKTRALPVRCLVSNPDRRLRPEMFATVTLPVGDGRRALLAVPEAAVVTDREEDGSEGQAVFVAGAEEGAYAKRRVTLGRSAGQRVEVASGLKEGERVVTAGAYTLLSESKKAELAEHEH
ncbi:MAG TPA: efflux RND transporter periplasmic adaptor subunit [Armatimonadaceae bacterium]|nr:efflux RND transporter periplasmic adaptor subunit [Armatimonadaceae bacterium]